MAEPTPWLNSVFQWLGKARLSSTLPVLSNGQVSDLQCDERSLLRVTDEVPSTYVPPAAKGKFGQIASSSGRLLEIQITNTSASGYFFLLFDATIAQSNGTSPKHVMYVPGLATVGLTFRSRLEYSNGLVWQQSTTGFPLTTIGGTGDFVVQAWRVLCRFGQEEAAAR